MKTTPTQRRAQVAALRREFHAAQTALAARQEAMTATMTGFQLQLASTDLLAAAAALSMAHARLASALISGRTIGRAATLLRLWQTWRVVLAGTKARRIQGVALFGMVLTEMGGNPNLGRAMVRIQQLRLIQRTSKTVQSAQFRSPTYMYRFPHIQPVDEESAAIFDDGDVMAGDDDQIVDQIARALDGQLRDEIDHNLEIIAQEYQGRIPASAPRPRPRPQDNVRNVGRNVTSGMSQVSRIWEGWARVSTTGTPCPWCAMLISRGAVYSTKESAQVRGSAKQGSRPAQVDDWRYHPNCACEPRLVMRGEYTAAPDLAQTRKMSVLWRDTVGAGTSGGYNGQDLDSDLKARWDAVSNNDPKSQFKRWRLVIEQDKRNQRPARRRAA